MANRHVLWTPIVAVALASTLPAPDVTAQARLASVKSLRCSFSRQAAGAWQRDGAADAAVKPATLILRFESIDADDGTAQLMSGSVGLDVTVRSAEGYL